MHCSDSAQSVPEPIFIQKPFLIYEPDWTKWWTFNGWATAQSHTSNEFRHLKKLRHVHFGTYCICMVASRGLWLYDVQITQTFKGTLCSHMWSYVNIQNLKWIPCTLDFVKMCGRVRVCVRAPVCVRACVCRCVYAHQMTFVCCPPLYYAGQMWAPSYRQLSVREDCRLLDPPSTQQQVDFLSPVQHLVLWKHRNIFVTLVLRVWNSFCRGIFDTFCYSILLFFLLIYIFLLFQRCKQSMSWDLFCPAPFCRVRQLEIFKLLNSFQKTNWLLHKRKRIYQCLFELVEVVLSLGLQDLSLGS